jgi:hypothetical protein
MSTRLRSMVGLIVVIFVAAAAIVTSIESSATPTLVGSWGGHQCVQVTIAHPVALPNLGRGRYGGLPYPETVDAAGRINLLLVRHFSKVASGISLSNDNETINIYTTALPRGMRVAVARLAPKDSISYYKCGNTLTSLYAIQHALGATNATFDRQGIDVVGYGTAITVNCEEIDVLRLTQPQLVLLQKDYGTNKICVHGITRKQVGTPI